jgi:hypothetical protein
MEEGRTAHPAAGPVERPDADAQVPGDAAHRLAAESAQADFVCLLRRIHSLCKAGGTGP